VRSPAPVPPGATAAPPAARIGAEAIAGQGRPAATGAEERAPADAGAGEVLSGELLLERVAALLTKRFLKTQLGDCDVEAGPEVVRLSSRSSTGEMLRANAPELSRAFSRVLGRAVEVEVSEGAAPASGAGAGGPGPGASIDPASIPLVRQTLELFDGKIKGIVRRE
jgi:hypothetical protein